MFADGSSEPFDVVIAATGFSSGLGSLVEAPGVLDEAGIPRGASGESTSCSGCTSSASRRVSAGISTRPIGRRFGWR